MSILVQRQVIFRKSTLPPVCVQDHRSHTKVQNLVRSPKRLINISLLPASIAPFFALSLSLASSSRALCAPEAREYPSLKVCGMMIYFHGRRPLPEFKPEIIVCTAKNYWTYGVFGGLFEIPKTFVLRNRDSSATAFLGTKLTQTLGGNKERNKTLSLTTSNAA